MSGPAVLAAPQNFAHRLFGWMSTSALRCVVRVRAHIKETDDTCVDAESDHRGRYTHADIKENPTVECSARHGQELTINPPGKKSYTVPFSTVLGPSATQHDLFKECGQPIIVPTR